ncbi:MAG: sugar phosphate isomerase/epimerase [Tepidisphaeraceae bacterium]
MSLRLSVQLYTLRDLTAKDFAGTVRQVKSIGYEGVELAGFGDLKSAKDVRKVLDDAGLVASGAHVPIEQFESNIKQVMDDYDTIGTKLLIVPWLEPKARGTDAVAWRALASTVTGFAQATRARGFTVAYHNHDFEFARFDGETALDIVWQHTDPSLVKCELDLYWVKRAGADPVSYLRRIGPMRLVSVHLKDMDKSDPAKFTQVGRGVLDWPTILRTLNDFRTPWGVVEQDDCYDVPPLESIRVSFENLKKLGV